VSACATYAVLCRVHASRFFLWSATSSMEQLASQRGRWTTKKGHARRLCGSAFDDFRVVSRSCGAGAGLADIAACGHTPRHRTLAHAIHQCVCHRSVLRPYDPGRPQLCGTQQHLLTAPTKVQTKVSQAALLDKPRRPRAARPQAGGRFRHPASATRQATGGISAAAARAKKPSSVTARNVVNRMCFF
jgi:hypothetical protein